MDNNTLAKRIGIQGVPGAFHEIAAQKYFLNETIEIVPFNTFEDLIQDLFSEAPLDYAIMAIENTIAGSLMQNYDLLQNHDVTVVGETFLRIEQNLMVVPGISVGDLKEVHSHPIAIEQCREYFKQFPEIKLIQSEDTALSAKRVKDQHLTDTGAIASTLAASNHDLEIIAKSIETNKQNYTRFLIVKRKSKETESFNGNKFSLSFSVSHEVGGLLQALQILNSHQANMTKIQSAPILGEPWRYRFYLDFVTPDQQTGFKCITELKSETINLKLLGCYPEGILTHQNEQ